VIQHLEWKLNSSFLYAVVDNTELYIDIDTLINFDNLIKLY